MSTMTMMIHSSTILYKIEIGEERCTSGSCRTTGDETVLLQREEEEEEEEKEEKVEIR